MAFLSDPKSEPAIRAPLSVWLLIVLLVGIELSREFLWSHASDSIFINYGFLPTRYSHAWLMANHVDPGNWLQRAIPFVSYMFLHGGLMHVGVNSLWLLAAGTIVARRIGTPLFLVFFLLCGVLAAASYLAVSWGSDDPMVGASGAISGLMAAGLRLMSASSSFAQRDGGPLQPIFSRQILSFSAFWILANAAAGFTGLGAPPGAGPQVIAWQAHIGGYIAGLLLIGLFYRPDPPPDEVPLG